MSDQQLLASHQISLDNRYQDKWVNGIFKDNILLNLAYLRGIKSINNQPDWNKTSQNFDYEFTIDPGQSFAFHDNIFPQYQGKVKMTTNSHFSLSEGYKFSGLLYGDGVCHLASLINWTAQDAGLQVLRPTSHDFADIPQIPKKYGTAIYFQPGSETSNQLQNLYITNEFNTPVKFKFNYQNGELKTEVFQKFEVKDKPLVQA